MIEQRLPIYSRWSLYALGAVEGRRILRPKDPVAAWLLRHHPGLLPSVPAPSILTTIRARTSMVDDLVLEEVARARHAGETLRCVTLGSAFDARWVRLYGAMSDVVASYEEVEDPDLLAYKERMMAGSPFQGRWQQVTRRPLPLGKWVVQSDSHRPIVVLEGLATRFEPSTLRDVLRRVRHGAPEARVIVDLAGTLDQNRSWSSRALAGLGWRMETSARVASRERLQTVTGQEICAGMNAFRVVVLSAIEPKQG